jgi:hypothetical protein
MLCDVYKVLLNQVHEEDVFFENVHVISLAKIRTSTVRHTSGFGKRGNVTEKEVYSQDLTVHRRHSRSETMH